jgi:threonylcarbamoyladenosine tRNA methylthiotransferase MtaB
VRTFHIQTLGCKVNHYESEQMAELFRSFGLTETDAASADVRLVHTCNVTSDAASKSRQALRRNIRLPVLQSAAIGPIPAGNPKARVIATGCWATGHPDQAQKLEGITEVITHHQDVAQRLKELLTAWTAQTVAEPLSFRRLTAREVRKNKPAGTHALPILTSRQSRHQRAFLKIQDGCDAHCTYCIIPSLRPGLWSKSPGDVVEEARRLVEAGHLEIVLTGIFLGAYGHETALRRRQTDANDSISLARLVDALCTKVPGLQRLRLSSLEPGDLNGELLSALMSHGQIVPHFHLPLQSGSDKILRRMNRQYTRADFLRMIDQVQSAFDRPALTTDIICGFPGESVEDFDQTLDVAGRAGFIHIHAFGFSARPQTAAARWTADFVPAQVTNGRVESLGELSRRHGFEFRKKFLGQTVRVMVERDDPNQRKDSPNRRHGRCERYFDVEFDGPQYDAGDLVELRIDRVEPDRTFGKLA